MKVNFLRSTHLGCARDFTVIRKEAVCEKICTGEDFDEYMFLFFKRIRFTDCSILVNFADCAYYFTKDIFVMVVTKNILHIPVGGIT